MAAKVLRIVVEDHLSPVIKAINDMREIHTDTLPSLPGTTVEVEQGADSFRPYIRIMPSPDLLAWLADVRRACRDARALMYVTGDYSAPRRLTGAEVEALDRP